MDAIRNNVNFSKFDLSHVHKTSMDMGQIVPIACIPTLPGDKINVDVDAFIRGMPTIAPIMDKVDIKINHFYVPYRVLWSRFEEFISHSDKYKLRGQPMPTMPALDTANLGDSFDYYFREEKAKVKPSDSYRKKLFDIGDKYRKKYPLGRLANYLGCDIGVTKNPDELKADLISLMPVLAYNRIFLDYYAPQRWINYFTQNNESHWLMKLSKLMEEIKNSNNYSLSSVTDLGSVDVLKFYGLGSLFKVSEPFDSAHGALLSLKNTYWNQDYFTSALPEPTLFGDVKLPVFNEAVTPAERHFAVSDSKRVDFVNPSLPLPSDDIKHNNKVLSTIRDLRKAISLQHYFETLTQAGGRYLETMEVMFGKRLPDDMLNYSEYLGGSVIPLFVNEVEQTAPFENKAGEQSYLGDLSGKPVGAGNSENVYFEADEYGVYMCLAHIVPKRSYFGLGNRVWRELDPLDLPNPAFEGLGDQAVYMYELGLTDFKHAHDIYGYVPRYAHYKTMLDRFSGEMVHSLKQWHLGDYSYSLFGKDSFVSVNPEGFECTPRNDIFHVPDEPDKFICTYNIKIDAVRPLAYEAPVGVSRI